MMLDQQGRHAAEELREYVAERVQPLEVGELKRIQRRRTLLSTLAAVVIVAAGVVGTALLVGGPNDDAPPVVTQPTIPAPVTTLPSTIQEIPSAARIIGPPATELPLVFQEAAVPAFSGIIAQTGHLPTPAFLAGETIEVRIEVAYEGPGGSLRADMLSAPANDQAFSSVLFGLDSPGSYWIFDGDQGISNFYGGEGVLISRRSDAAVALESLDYQTPSITSWESLCARTDQDVAALGEVAGRSAHVVTCAGIKDSWTLWVDAETGLVLKLEHETDARRVPGVGSFEFETITYTPRFDGIDFEADPITDPDFPTPKLRQLPATTTTMPAPELPDPSAPLNAGIATVGQPFPSFTGTLLTGETYELPVDPDKPIVLLGWYAAAAQIDAGPYPETRALDLMEAYHREYSAAIDFVAVVKPWSSASPEVVEMIREAHGYTFSIVVDPDPFAPRDPAVWILIEPDGTVGATTCACDGVADQAVPLLISKALAAAG